MASPQISPVQPQHQDALGPREEHTAPDTVCVNEQVQPKPFGDIFEKDVDGAELVEWFRALFDGATTFASILAAVMFSSMILDLRTQNPPHGSEGEVRIWSAVGAILFVLLVLLCQGSSLLLRFHHEWFEIEYDGKKFWPRLFLSVISLFFQALWLTGTIFFCLVVKAYVTAVGWTAVGLTVILAIVCAGFWIVQFRREMRSQCKKRQRLKKNSQGQKSRPPDVERQDGQVTAAADVQ